MWESVCICVCVSLYLPVLLPWPTTSAIAISTSTTITLHLHRLHHRPSASPNPSPSLASGTLRYCDTAILEHCDTGTLSAADGVMGHRSPRCAVAKLTPPVLARRHGLCWMPPRNLPPSCSAAQCNSRCHLQRPSHSTVYQDSLQHIGETHLAGGSARCKALRLMSGAGSESVPQRSDTGDTQRRRRPRRPTHGDCTQRTTVAAIRPARSS